MRLSVVIPTWNEGETIASALDSLPKSAEAIVSDGGSSDGTGALAAARGARVVVGSRGRARQMNRGARAAGGDVLLFLHADGVLGSGADRAIESALEDPATLGGSFTLRIRSRRRALAAVAFGSNVRARYLRMPYGDQGLFVRRSAFEDLGGFPEIPFLEDVSLIRMLRRRGRLVQLAVPIVTGDRHWKRLGLVGTTFLDWTMVALFLGGVRAEALAPLYLRLRGNEADLEGAVATAAQPD